MPILSLEFWKPSQKREKDDIAWTNAHQPHAIFKKFFLPENYLGSLGNQAAAKGFPARIGGAGNLSSSVKNLSDSTESDRQEIFSTTTLFCRFHAHRNSDSIMWAEDS